MAARIKFLIVDEYQDVNPLQECLIQLLHGLGAQICVVGDDDQTIYQWNGSDIANIVEFAQRYLAVFQVPLDDNFRSSKGVVETARSVVERNGGRLSKRMRSQEQQIFDYGDLLSLKFASLEEEAQWITKKIQDLRGIPFTEKSQTRGLTWSDCAILLRSVRNSAAPILMALRRAGIPYVVKGMNGLFDTPEVKAAVSIFYYLNDEIDRQALVQHWNVANLGVVPADIETGIAWLDSEKADWPQRWQKSTYALQHTYLGFLKAIGLREERINNLDNGVNNRSELVYYNLGKFSQVITDFEEINFHSDPSSLYSAFAGFLRYQAPDYYPEGWEDAGFARPDAVQIMTVHQAKGMEFPVVFIPNLLRNRFPPRKPGGRQWWHVIPRQVVVGADRYDGSVEDERRLFYVALTRSKKYLYCTWAPEAATGHYARRSDFIQEFTASEYVLTGAPTPGAIVKLEPQPAKAEIEVVLTFSELKYFFECPYQFKLRFLYGFNPGFFEKLGYGKSLHDALAEVHRRALDGDYLSSDAIPALLETHLHLPYAWDKLRDDMRQQAEQVLRKYLHENNHLLDKIEYAEQTIELKLANGVVVHGRIDLIRRTDTRQVIIIDFKSTDRAQEEDVSQEQLHIYAMGYQQLTGRSADLVEVYNLDQGAGATVRELVDENLLLKTEERVITAGRAIRDNRLSRLSRCKGCDMQGVCRSDI